MTSTTPQAQAPAESSSQDMSQIPSQASESEPDMPEQRHAGKVGYGPNYHVGAVSPSINIPPIKFYSSSCNQF